MFSKSLSVAVLGCCLLGLSPAVVNAASEDDTASAERCIPLVRIDRTDVVDDYTILFYMRSKDVYVNRLKYRCPGLKNEHTFMYRTSMSQLCDLDVITVLYDYGFGFTPGASCGLGRFYPISRDEAKELKEGAPKDVEEKAVPTAEPEDVVD